MNWRRPLAFALAALACSQLAGCFSFRREAARPGRTTLGSPLIVLPVQRLGTFLILESKWDRGGPWHFLIDTGANTVTFGTALYGQFGFTKKGSGELILEGLDSFASGNVTLAAGTLTMAKQNTMAGVLNGLSFGSPSSLTFTGDATLKYATGVTTDMSPSLVAAAGKTGTIDTNGNDVTFTHSVAGTGTLTKVGAGILSLDSANTLTGTVNVNAGTLALTAFGSLDTPATIAVGAAGTFDAVAPAGFTLASGQTLTGTGAVNVGAANALAIASSRTQGE